MVGNNNLIFAIYKTADQIYAKASFLSHFYYLSRLFLLPVSFLQQEPSIRNVFVIYIDVVQERFLYQISKLMN